MHRHHHGSSAEGKLRLSRAAKRHKKEGARTSGWSETHQARENPVVDEAENAHARPPGHAHRHVIVPPPPLAPLSETLRREQPGNRACATLGHAPTLRHNSAHPARAVVRGTPARGNARRSGICACASARPRPPNKHNPAPFARARVREVGLHAPEAPAEP